MSPRGQGGLTRDAVQKARAESAESVKQDDVPEAGSESASNGNATDSKDPSFALDIEKEVCYD